MVSNGRLYDSATQGEPSYYSTASAPSLRAKTPDPAAMDSTLLGEDSSNVKVVVRCRKFLPREIERNAKCLIRMDPNTQQTVLLPPIDGDGANMRSQSRKVFEEKSFAFDRSFWSHNETDRNYAMQEDVYNSFGEEFLDHNFDGYHTCILAYGQTGSGKTYTMMGTPDQPGLIPRTCEGLFQRIDAEESNNITYNVHVSYFEVYNEQVRDLLVPRSNPPAYLKIRESKTDGVYVQNLTDVPVKSFSEIERLMDKGAANRTTAATKMNDTSSRSHAVFTIVLKQIQHDMATDETIERCARMRLVDLAGSERAKSTEATGQRLREGGNINQSLSTLGRVIAALANDKPGGRPMTPQGTSGSPRPQNPRSVKRGPLVPYRDSVLTWLLKDSLGGNSKTAMVACIAPSDYDETLSTLRYAACAKRIRTRAIVNQDALSAAERDAKIAQMAEQIRLLQLSVQAATNRKRDDLDRQANELDDYQRQVQTMQRLMEDTRQVSETKVKALTSEVDELTAVNEALRGEIAALRRHLGLVVDELRNPIQLPASMAEEQGAGKDDDESGSDSGYEEHGEQYEHEDMADATADIHVHADEFLEDLRLLKAKIADDRSRFDRWGRSVP